MKTQFGQVSTENWHEKCANYKEKLIDKSNRPNLPIDFLRNCLEKIEPGANDKIALLPVGAYLARNGEQRIWIDDGLSRKAI